MRWRVDVGMRRHERPEVLQRNPVSLGVEGDHFGVEFGVGPIFPRQG